VTAHVLIVEDSALVVGALQLLLEGAGHRVSSAGSVREAVARARVDPPDVMLLDLTLPDGDGLVVLDVLAADGAAPRVTVAVTGRDEPTVRERCLRAGCREVLVKPIAPLALPRSIESWLSTA
jgi:CheY-like chemotaxis protein